MTLESGLGSVQPRLAIALLVQYVLLFLAIQQGVEHVQRVVMVTMPLPFILLAGLLVYGATLEGAGDGVEAYLSVDATAIANPRAWVDAYSQVFYGLGIGLAGIIAVS